MSKSGPGKSYRKGITLLDAVQKFDTEDKAEAWFVEQRWPSGVACPFCGTLNVAVVASRKPQPFRCREKECRKSFSVKTGTLLHSSNLPLSKWAIAFFLYATNLKGVSSMKLHRDLGIAQSSAWYMAHRIREMWTAEAEKFAGPVEVDETYIGGKERNKHESKLANRPVEDRGAYVPDMRLAGWAGRKPDTHVAHRGTPNGLSRILSRGWAVWPHPRVVSRPSAARTRVSVGLALDLKRGVDGSHRLGRNPALPDLVVLEKPDRPVHRL